MSLLQTDLIGCPYCGETIEIVVDCSLEIQSYIEDCSVCCRPLTLEITYSDAQILKVVAKREDD
ncbi:MAG: CPXCG motif-containing cysteine-rich protein [Candidatus Thiodiazotropha sp. (ex. Lucinoma kazani)]|nr:CPXCG motif-containing cysteine-rich protein [Candidatus Thiodiazotropha sp. (ex Lucinoma borealis)]